MESKISTLDQQENSFPHLTKKLISQCHLFFNKNHSIFFYSIDRHKTLYLEQAIIKDNQLRNGNGVESCALQPLLSASSPPAQQNVVLAVNKSWLQCYNTGSRLPSAPPKVSWFLT